MTTKNKDPVREFLRVDTAPQSDWKLLESGGEAYIYELPDMKLAKIYRSWTDTLVKESDNPGLSEMIKNKFWENQWKLPALPELPSSVAKPIQILASTKGSIIGYTMERITDVVTLDCLWKRVGEDEKLAALSATYDLIDDLHKDGIIIGDLKPRDLAWKRKEKRIYLFDADSVSFDGFECRTFSPGYVDRELLSFDYGRNKQILMSLKRPYEKVSDWVAFLATALNVFTGIDPYDGTHKKIFTKEERIRDNVSIFSKEVKYPISARPLTDIPRPLLEAIFLAFRRGDRIIPDKTVLLKGGTNDASRKRPVS